MNGIPSSAMCSGSALGLLIRRVRDNMRARMERELATTGHDLNFTQYITIKKLATGIASVTDLARAAEVNPGAMTRLLDKLETKGLVMREADPGDRRALHIRLTEAGHAIHQDIEQCGQRVHKAALAGFSDEQRSQLFGMLEHMRDNLAVPES